MLIVKVFNFRFWVGLDVSGCLLTRLSKNICLYVCDNFLSASLKFMHRFLGNFIPISILTQISIYQRLVEMDQQVTLLSHISQNYLEVKTTFTAWISTKIFNIKHLQ